MIAIQIGIIIFLVLVLAIILQDEYKKKKLTRKRAKTHRFWKNGTGVPGSERRKSVRIDTDIDVLYEVVSGEKLNRQSSMARNISAGGINLALNEKLLPETALRLELDLPQAPHPIMTQGKIVWVKEISERFIMQKTERYFSTGIKFIEMNEQDLNILQNFINHHVKNTS
ncbi:MAG: PilZ domain-containing protein [Candidatus Omnitrophica bacterium]|nr:PilZ domain-containing protein [Candidatus Omnitrophota bacterium]